jgi:hypothetical protein
VTFELACKQEDSTVVRPLPFIAIAVTNWMQMNARRYVAISLRRMFHGSWMPLLVLAAALKMITGLWFAQAMSMIDGRSLLAARDAVNKEK